MFQDSFLGLTVQEEAMDIWLVRAKRCLRTPLTWNKEKSKGPTVRKFRSASTQFPINVGG